MVDREVEHIGAMTNCLSKVTKALEEGSVEAALKILRDSLDTLEQWTKEADESNEEALNG